MEANRWLLFIIMGITFFFAKILKGNANKKLCVQVVTVILTCFSGFRSWQMGDLYHYCYAYLECNSPTWKLDLVNNGDTIGLQLFFHGAGSLGISFEVCLFIIAAFVAITLGVLVYKYSPSPYWSYIIYISMGFYISSFNILKQIIAMGFIILAMIAIIERRPVRYLLFVALATFFHFPAVIFIVAYPFAHKKVDAMYFVMIVAMFAAVFLFREQIVHQATQIYYVDDMSFKATETVGFKVIMMVVILLFAHFIRPLRSYDKIYNQVFNILILAILVQTFSVYDNVFSRLADYFYQFVVIFIPLMLQPGDEQAMMYPNHAKKIRYFTDKSYTFIYICVTAFAVWYYFRYLNASAELLSGFHFFWQVDSPSSLDLLKNGITSLGGN